MQPPGKFCLRPNGNTWELIFEGERAILKHEQGLYYVAYLLKNPPEDPLHGMALALKAKREIFEPGTCATLMLHPETGKTLPIPRDAMLEQFSLDLEEAEAAASLRKKQLQLEAIIDNDDTIEPVKAEVYRELEAIYRYQNQTMGRTRDLAQRTAAAVSKAIKRLYQNLSVAINSAGKPHFTVRRFAEHLKYHLLIPSGRFSKGGRRGVGHIGGCFVYEAPFHVVWK